MPSVSRHLIDPELIDLLDQFPTEPLSDENLGAIREAIRVPMPGDVAAPAVPLVESTRRVPGPRGAPDVEILTYRPEALAGPTGCIFHIHGGGYVAGDAAARQPAHRRLAADLGCSIVSVNYRLAPETRFPGSIEDCYAALSWVFGNAAELSIDRARIGVMGESAGGGLAAALALLARDRGEFRLAFQHLIYPMLDDRTCVARDPHPYAGEFLWTAHNNRFGWSALLGAAPGSAGVSPYAAAARASDLSKLPPTFLATGALDLFVEENLEYARRLMRAGVPVELRLYAGSYHAFDMHPTARVAETARRDSQAALARALGSG